MARRRSLRRLEAPLPQGASQLGGQGSGAIQAPRPVVKTAPPTLQTTLIFLGITLYLGTTVFRLGVQEWHLFKQSQVLEAERVEVVAHRQALTAEIASTRTNAGIEKLAREQLGLVMAQEIPVKTIAPATPVPSTPVLAARPRPGAHNDLPPAMAALVKFFEPLWN